MGWRGVKNTLPSRVQLFSSKRRAGRNVADGRSNGYSHHGTDSRSCPEQVPQAGSFGIEAEGRGRKDLCWGFGLTALVSRYFSSTDSMTPTELPLLAMFDALRKDETGDGKDALGVNSSMEYFQKDLGVNLENAELLVAFEIVHAPSLGVIDRKGYVNGWKSIDIPHSPTSHADYVRRKASTLSTNPAYFKQVYRHTFDAGKETGQKSLGVENALVYWEMLFSPPGRGWKTASHDWFELWKRFLGEKWTRSVNRDMWNQTLEFALKTMETRESETLGFWSEDGAWPTVIDEFVEWCWAEGGVKKPKGDVEMT